MSHIPLRGMNDIRTQTHPENPRNGLFLFWGGIIKNMNKSLRIFVFLLFIALIGAGFYFYNTNSDYSLPSFDKTIESVRTASKEVVTPSPLRGPTEPVVESNLTVEGIIAETNEHRLEHGLEPLSVNPALRNAAETKAEDMFPRQYFAHESPTGEGPSDLADAAGYDYLTIGENLILGNYENNSALVQAWMDSPGHRANIFNAKFKEIGVSLQKGIYKDSSVWIGVQEFGRPASDCPTINKSLQAQIEENQQLLEEWAEELDRRGKNLERRPGRSPQYKKELDEYNELINEYNGLLEETKRLVDEYNSQVEAYNLCIK
jgi:uncharacterized protein YkwD